MFEGPIDTHQTAADVCAQELNLALGAEAVVQDHVPLHSYAIGGQSLAEPTAGKAEALGRGVT